MCVCVCLCVCVCVCVRAFVYSGLLQSLTWRSGAGRSPAVLSGTKDCLRSNCKVSAPVTGSDLLPWRDVFPQCSSVLKSTRLNILNVICSVCAGCEINLINEQVCGTNSGINGRRGVLRRPMCGLLFVTGVIIWRSEDDSLKDLAVVVVAHFRRKLNLIGQEAFHQELHLWKK